MKLSHLALCSVFLVLSVQARTWTAANGKEVEAKLVSVKADKVLLARDSDGREFEVEISQLSKEDGIYISEWKLAQPLKSEEVLVNNDNGVLSKPVSNFVDNYDNDWPTLITLKKDFDIDVVSEEDGSFIYESRHFTFHADARLSNSVVKRFAEIFEATLLYCQEIPISSQVAIHHTDERRKNIYLYAEKSAYYRAGGMEGSAGCYYPNKDIILVGMPFLGLKKMGSGYTLDRDKSSTTLSHEIVHMFTDRCYYAPGAMGWFSEGLAEYIAVTPYRGAKYSVRGNRSALMKYITAYGENNEGGKALGEEIHVGPLKNYFLQPYSSFTANGRLNYGVGTLLVYYFFHFEGDGDRKLINAFMKGLRAGKHGQDALDILLDGRTYEELELDIYKAWRSRGVKLYFSNKK